MKFILVVLTVTSLFFASNVFAGQDTDSSRLTERIKALEERIAVLESRFSFASFMPDFAERFHVMHKAADAEDWAVASHELQEMKQLVESSATIDAEKGLLFQSMMTPVLEKLDDAIAHSSQKKMPALLSEAVQACNSCHAATGSPFIKVKLDTSGSMSMRHPHSFTKQKVGTHMH